MSSPSKISINSIHSPSVSICLAWLEGSRVGLSFTASDLVFVSVNASALMQTKNCIPPRDVWRVQWVQLDTDQSSDSSSFFHLACVSQFVREYFIRSEIERVKYNALRWRVHVHGLCWNLGIGSLSSACILNHFKIEFKTQQWSEKI